MLDLKGIWGFNNYFVGEKPNVTKILNFDLADLNSVKAVNTAAIKGNAVLVIKSLLRSNAVILLKKSVILNKKLITGGNLNLNLRANTVTVTVKKVTAAFTAVTAARANSGSNGIIIRIVKTNEVNVFIITFFFAISALI